MVLIIGLVVIIRPDKFVWEYSHFGIQRADSKEAEDAAEIPKCLSPHSSDNTAACLEEADNHPKANGVREFSKINGSRESRSGVEVGKANTQAIIGVEAEVKAIVKVIEERSLLHALLKTNATISSAIYRDIPPAYDDLIKVSIWNTMYMPVRQICVYLHGCMEPC